MCDEQNLGDTAELPRLHNYNLDTPSYSEFARMDRPYNDPEDVAEVRFICDGSDE